MDFQTIAVIVFVLLLAGFLLAYRRQVHLQKLLFPLLYVVLYRSRLGLRQMEQWAKRHPRFWLWFGYVGVWIGFLGMAIICVMLFHSLWRFLTAPGASPGVALVLPFKAKGTFYVPFFYWIITIFIIAVVHEFCHGVLSRVHDIPIKSSGFAFLSVLVPILPAAFVEPDEKKLAKKKAMAQLSVFAAGPISNIVMAGMTLLIVLYALNPLAAVMFNPTGVSITGFANMTDGSKYPAELAGIQIGDRIVAINDVPLSTVEEFTQKLSALSPGTEITVATNRSAHALALATNPEDPKKPYMGVFVQQETERDPQLFAKYGSVPFAIVEWFMGLAFWLYVLSLGIGLFNLLPLGPIDGGRMLKTALESMFHEQRAFHIWKWTSVFFLLLILLNLGVGFLR